MGLSNSDHSRIFPNGTRTNGGERWERAGQTHGLTRMLGKGQADGFRLGDLREKQHTDQLGANYIARQALGEKAGSLEQ